MRQSFVAGDLARDFLARADKEGVHAELNRLWRNWSEAMGEETSRMVLPLGHSGEALVVGVEDSMLMQDMVHYGPALVELANAYLGRKLFDTVKVELLRGRVPLGAPSGDRSEKDRYWPDKPKDIGGLMDAIPPDTAPGRCYRAYVAFMNRTENEQGGP